MSESKSVPRFVVILALGTFVVVLDTTFMNVSITTLVVAFICLIGFFLSGNLPKKSLTELSTGEG